MGSYSKEQILQMCEELEKIASSENREKTKICHETPNRETPNRVWVDAKNLDWLCDELEESVALRLRQAFAFNIDGEGAYYYYDFHPPIEKIERMEKS